MSSTIVSSLRETSSVFTIMAVQWHRLIVQLPLMGQEQTNVEPLNEKKKERKRGEGCLLEVISHNQAVAVVTGGISLPLCLITVCLSAPKGLKKFKYNQSAKTFRTGSSALSGSPKMDFCINEMHFNWH